MSDTSDGSEEEITFGQKILDNIFILLALGIAFPGIFYFAWGLLEIFVFNSSSLSEYLQTHPIGGK